jgi:hypothetical protein
MKYAILFLTCLVAAPAFATLGGTVGSIEEDIRILRATKVQVVRRHLKAAGIDVPGAGYVVHQLDVEGIEVREFANAAGRIFGIAWSGPRTADLQTLLGSYFSEFDHQQNLQRRLPGRQPTALVTPQIQVERWGHMNQLHGRAFIPGLLPTAFPSGAIQ